MSRRKVTPLPPAKRPTTRTAIDTTQFIDLGKAMKPPKKGPKS